MAINVTATPIVIQVQKLPGAWTTSLPKERNPELDIFLDASYSYDADDGITEVSPYIPEITITAYGTWLNVHVEDNVIPLTITVLGTAIFDNFNVSSDPIEIAISVEDVDIAIERKRTNWLKWSNIGSLDFTIWKDNVAGERPVDWAGWIYGIKKLSNKVIVYGQNGVTFLTPVNNLWGMSTVSRIGLKGRSAFCGNEFIHFYVDIDGRLCQIDEKIDILGYEEYLSTLASNLVMSYDEMNQLIYICDGILGYVYSIRNKSLGQGPANITGIGYQSGVSYVGASSAISIEPFELCTDIYDLGNRKNKTIMSMEIGIDLTQTLYSAIDYRISKAAAFATTPWAIVNPNGVTPIPCFGVEFRFRLKTLVYEAFEIDYIRVNGIVHNYSYLDSFSREGR